MTLANIEALAQNENNNGLTLDCWNDIDNSNNGPEWVKLIAGHVAQNYVGLGQMKVNVNSNSQA